MNDSSAEFDPDDAPAVFTRDVFATSTSRVPLLTTDHQGLDVLSPDECRELLRHEQVGRIGFNERGQTVMLPVNYAFVAGSILFRTSVGSKLDIAQIGAPASFEIDDFDVKARTGWSVLVKGHAAEVTDEWFVSICEHFDVEPWADHIPRDHWVRLTADEITGRWIFRISEGTETGDRPGS
jgi:hypothetical protein